MVIKSFQMSGFAKHVLFWKGSLETSPLPLKAKGHFSCFYFVSGGHLANSCERFVMHLYTYLCHSQHLPTTPTPTIYKKNTFVYNCKGDSFDLGIFGWEHDKKIVESPCLSLGISPIRGRFNRWTQLSGSANFPRSAGRTPDPVETPWECGGDTGECQCSGNPLNGFFYWEVFVAFRKINRSF